MNLNLNKKGFTLVEQIAAIAIISMVLVAFIPMFISYYKNTSSNGTRTKNTFEVKKEIDNVIQNPTTNNTNQSTPIPDLQLTDINGNVIVIKSNGKIVSKTSNNITISTFVPDGTPEN